MHAGLILPFSMQEALMNGGKSPAEVESALYRGFYKLLAVAGVACAVTAGVGFHLMRYNVSK
jgi:hypothetical protein